MLNGFKPFKDITNSKLNIEYYFTYVSSSKTYNLIIEIDEFNDSLIVNTECNCKDFYYNHNKYFEEKGVHYKCKHLLSAIEELKNWGVEYRELQPKE